MPADDAWASMDQRDQDAFVQGVKEVALDFQERLNKSNPSRVQMQMWRNSSLTPCSWEKWGLQTQRFVHPGLRLLMMIGSTLFQKEK